MKSLMKSLKSNSTAEWAIRHNNAINEPSLGEWSIVQIANSIDTLIKTHELPDYFLLEQVIIPMLEAFRSMLNFDLGRMDGGTLDAWAVELGTSLGINMDTMELEK